MAKNVFCLLADLIGTVDRLVALRRQQAEQIGLSAFHALDLRNALKLFSAITENLSAKPPQSPLDARIAVDQLARIAEGLDTLVMHARDWQFQHQLRELSHCPVFTQWAEFVIGAASATMPPNPAAWTQARPSSFVN